MLFMACSPTDLAGSTLSFEHEEEQILDAVERFQIDMRIEDSGSLDGLEAMLQENNGFDVVHLTGHAGVEDPLGPVFYMENEIGELHKVTPELLWQKLRDYPPKLLFLSGCSTGKSNQRDANAFAYAMVQQGAPTALGWGLPVSDAGATRLTAELYKYLATGKPVDHAVMRARQFVRDHYHPWPLLRIFADASPLAPLIAPGQKLRPKSPRGRTYKMLTDSHVRVLERGFVGRRRDIQQGVRTLRGENEQFGLLIRGPAGVGKSCLAGKLIERFHGPDREVLVFHGELRPADIFYKLQKLCDRKGQKRGLDILKQEKEYEDKIKAFFREIFPEMPVLIYFDDFEQNLAQAGEDWQVKPELVETVRPFLQALDWCEGAALLLLTSRYPFRLETDGDNLPREKLFDLSLMSFRGADLDKKVEALPNIARSEHNALYRKHGHGNPRLLDWLEQIAADEDKYDLAALETALADKSEDYVRDYLADFLVQAEGQAFSDFLQRAAVFRLPVEKEAFLAFDDEKMLQKGVDLTLFERDHPAGQAPTFWVTPVIREQEFAKLPAADQKATNRTAYNWYAQTLGDNPPPPPEPYEEAINHALACDEISGACKYAVILGNYLRDMLLYRQCLSIQMGVAQRVTEAEIEKAKQTKDGWPAVFLNDLGTILHRLGERQTAIHFYEKALDLDLSVYSNKDSRVAIRYNNLGEAWRALGEPQKAVDFFQQALAIFEMVYGPEHPSTQTVRRNLESIKNE